MDYKYFDNNADRTIVALHGALQNYDAWSAYLNFRNMTKLVEHGKEFGYNILFPQAPLRVWVARRKPGTILKLAHEIANLANNCPRPILAGFSDGGTMVQYCAYYTPIYEYYVIHSGLLPRKPIEISGKTFYIVVGENDQFEKVIKNCKKMKETYSKKNVVDLYLSPDLDHRWDVSQNSYLFPAVDRIIYL